jgi:hypothetical protein
VIDSTGGAENPSLSAIQSQRNQAAFREKSLENTAIPRFSVQNRTGESASQTPPYTDEDSEQHQGNEKCGQADPHDHFLTGHLEFGRKCLSVLKTTTKFRCTDLIWSILATPFASATGQQGAIKLHRDSALKPAWEQTGRNSCRHPADEVKHLVCTRRSWCAYRSSRPLA